MGLGDEITRILGNADHRLRVFFVTKLGTCKDSAEYGMGRKIISKEGETTSNIITDTMEGNGEIILTNSEGVLLTVLHGTNGDRKDPKNRGTREGRTETKLTERGDHNKIMVIIIIITVVNTIHFVQ